MCEYNGMQSTLCDNIEAYAQACKSAGVTISWRNRTFCREWSTPECKEHPTLTLHILKSPPPSSHSNTLPTKQPLLRVHSTVPAHMLWPLSHVLPPPSNRMRGRLSVWFRPCPQRQQLRSARQMWLPGLRQRVPWCECETQYMLCSCWPTSRCKMSASGTTTTFFRKL